jgi:formiminoglutamase
VSFLEISRGDSPLVLGLPHTGTELPENVAKDLNETGRARADTDWHIHQLYDGLVPDVTTVRTLIHRYAIDVNRDPAGASLYPGQNTTALCPVTDFDGLPIYQDGVEPDAAEIESRRQLYHAPYHEALGAELARVKAIHGFVILYDCHSIRSQIPFLFDGVLPDFNIGTDEGRTCESAIEALVTQRCHAAEGYRTVLNGRFKGGWTTRHYGRPTDGLHAIQMELAQSTYMLEHPPWTYESHVAERVRPHLKLILQDLTRWSPA